MDGKRQSRAGLCGLHANDAVFGVDVSPLQPRGVHEAQAGRCREDGQTLPVALCGINQRFYFGSGEGLALHIFIVFAQGAYPNEGISSDMALLDGILIDSPKEFDSLIDGARG